MNYLLVVAHPDDEVLGAGATIKKLTSVGHNVDICIMCTEAKARAFRPEDEELPILMQVHKYWVSVISMRGPSQILK